MLNPPQFSLAYLLLEIFWIATALASFRAVWTASLGQHVIAQFVVLELALVATGAAFGGLFGRMIDGIVWAFTVVFVLLFASFLLMFGAAMLS